MDTAHNSHDCINAINVLIENIIENDNISFSQIVDLLRSNRKQKKIVTFPSCILRNRSLGILEAVTKYLKEELNLRYHSIAGLLNRDDRSIWISYQKARGKVRGRFIIDRMCLLIPVSVFTNRKLGLLENLTLYLKEKMELKYRDMAKLLNRDNRTIWTCYNKAKKKVNERK